MHIATAYMERASFSVYANYLNEGLAKSHRVLHNLVSLLLTNKTIRSKRRKASGKRIQYSVIFNN